MVGEKVPSPHQIPVPDKEKCLKGEGENIFIYCFSYLHICGLLPRAPVLSFFF